MPLREKCTSHSRHQASRNPRPQRSQPQSSSQKRFKYFHIIAAVYSLLSLSLARSKTPHSHADGTRAAACCRRSRIRRARGLHSAFRRSTCAQISRHAWGIFRSCLLPRETHPIGVPEIPEEMAPPLLQPPVISAPYSDIPHSCRRSRSPSTSDLSTRAARADGADSSYLWGLIMRSVIVRGGERRKWGLCVYKYSRLALVLRWLARVFIYIQEYNGRGPNRITSDESRSLDLF